MKTMTPFKFRLLHAVVRVGTILLCDKDKTTSHYNGEPDYKATVISKGKNTFTTNIENSINPPLEWNERYNFRCRIYKI